MKLTATEHRTSIIPKLGQYTDSQSPLSRVAIHLLMDRWRLPTKRRTIRWQRSLPIRKSNARLHTRRLLARRLTWTRAQRDLWFRVDSSHRWSRSTWMKHARGLAHWREIWTRIKLVGRIVRFKKRSQWLWTKAAQGCQTLWVQLLTRRKTAKCREVTSVREPRVPSNQSNLINRRL